MSRATTWRSSTAGPKPIDRLPALAVDLVRRKVAVIGAMDPFGTGGQGGDTTIPIVFDAGDDPVGMGSSPVSPGRAAT